MNLLAYILQSWQADVLAVMVLMAAVLIVAKVSIK